MIGQTISHYRIVEKLAEGGMGVVYQAEDTKLDRTVALKFLAEHLLRDEDGRRRFIREAKAAAALQHPNICTVYEIDEVEGHTFIAMARIEGPSLEKKIEAGPLKLDEALDIAMQVAKGLQAAHGKGIVHRDIKPANIMLTETEASQRQVTIMDFGLARLANRSKLTRIDQTLGTVAYMSPEQTMGADVDHRTDIWAFGVVLYEMITGQQPFKGHYDKAVMYSITNEKPEPLTALRTGVPMELEWMIGKALAKNPDERYQHVDEILVDLRALQKERESVSAVRALGGPADQAAIELPVGQPLRDFRIVKDLGRQGDYQTYKAEDTRSKRSVALKILPQEAAQAAERRQRRKTTQQLGLVALVSVALGVILATWLRLPAPTVEGPLRRFSLQPGNTPGRPAISPDGKHVAYITARGLRRRLWIHDLDQDQRREIEGTEGAWNPFWSPGSDSVGFIVRTELKRVPVQGGSATVICELPSRPGDQEGDVITFPEMRHSPELGFEGTWSPDGNSIVFSAGPPFRLYEVPARGGAPELLMGPRESASGEHFIQPHFLQVPGGDRSLLFTVRTPEESRIVVQDLSTREEELLGSGAFPVYAPSGHIVYQTSLTGKGLWALPFSASTLTATAEAFPVAKSGFQPSVAGDGTLVYLNAGGDGSEQLVWRNQEGEKVGVIGQPQKEIFSPAVSPDGKRVAVRGREDENFDIWIHETSRPVKTRITFDPAVDYRPIWSPKGDSLIFCSSRKGGSDIFETSLEGHEQVQELSVTRSVEEYTTGRSADGKYIVYAAIDERGQTDIGYLQRREGEGGYESIRFAETAFNEASPTLSPDGRYLAYQSDESGRAEIYIQRFPEGGRKRRVSLNGGSQSRWSNDGKDLFYVEGDILVAVPVRTTPTLSLGTAKRLFSNQGFARPGDQQYDVSADGQRFVLVEALEEPAGPIIRVVENWHTEFRDRDGR